VSASALELEAILHHSEYPMKLSGPEVLFCSAIQYPLISMTNAYFVVSHAPTPFINLGTIFLLRGAVIPRVTLFPNYLHYKLSQASSVMVNQVIKVRNQNSKSGVRI
jgi:hypothetical protein